MTALSEYTSYDIVAMFNDDHANANANANANVNGDSGTVNIISFYHPIIPARILPASSKIFKYGKCWISSGYQELLRRIPKNSPFIVNNVQRNHRPTGTELRFDVSADGSAAEITTASVFVPIFSCGLPSLDEGVIKNLDVFGFTTIMILNKGVIYGPFNITVLEDKSLQVSTTLQGIKSPLDYVMKVGFRKVKKTDVFVNPKAKNGLPIEGFITSISDFKRYYYVSWA